MSYAERHAVAVTTDSSGDFTGYTPTITGRIIAVIYTKVDFADGVDFTITADVTGQNIWTESTVNAAKTVAPRQPTHSQVGVASLLVAAGEPVEDYIVVANERVEVVVADGGDTKTGTITVIVG